MSNQGHKSRPSGRDICFHQFLEAIKPAIDPFFVNLELVIIILGIEKRLLPVNLAPATLNIR
ncbi:MAG: hypothetical protein KOO62_09120 [candidate division Zixibacteria bacterium]|nr:hypothetical protein [candidate division Zixibacteria bacterium]